MKVVIVGAYGGFNIGDELILHSLVSGVREEDPKANIIVIPKTTFVDEK